MLRVRFVCACGVRFLLSLLMGIILAHSPAAAGRWDSLATTVFHNYGRDHGLPHPVPTALAQDRQGFLWVGTQGGLARWDGYRFHTYRADHERAGSLPDDWVQTLHVDTAGRLWVGGGAGGLSRYDPASDRFVVVPLGPSKGRTHIGAIIDDGRGGLWIGRQDGLRHLDPATGRVTTIGTGLPEAVVQSILRDRRGNLWVGSAKGLARRARDARDFVPVPVDGGQVAASALFEDRDGRIWIGTQQHGLFVIDRPGAAARPIGANRPAVVGQVSAIVAAAPHRIWASLRGGGILSVDTRTGEITPIRHDRTQPNSLTHNDVWTLLRDNMGSLWAGTSGGLSYAPRNAGLIRTVFGGSDRPGGLNATDILSIVAARDGGVWLGYLDGGADQVDPVTGKVTAFRPDRSPDGVGLPPDAMFAMAEGGDGTIWFGTRRGLYARAPGSATPRRITIPGRDPRASVTALGVDAGTLWVGGEEDGLWGYVPASGQVVFGPKQSAAIADRGVGVIMRSPGRFLWIGTRNGLHRIDLVSGGIDHIRADPADPQALSSRNVIAILFDRQQRMWVGTFGGGLALMTTPLDAPRPRFRRFGTAEGLPHANVDSLQMDGAGVIWAGTDDGLARVDPATLKVRPVRRADGSFLVDNLAGAGATTPAGEALFGSLGGLSVVRPGDLPLWTFRPPVVVTELSIGGDPMPVALINDANSGEPLVIPANRNSLAVEFAALDFTAPERNRYAYRLDGFDDDWIETDTSRRLAIYTNLPPGDYTLRLRGTNRAGQWSERELAVPLTVQPAWYQQLWFHILSFLLLVAAVAGLDRWRTTYMRQRQNELEGQIAERTADLRAALERLGQLATTDPLTECANRWYFIEQARDLINAEGSQGGAISLIVLDIDKFKDVNDSFGHPVGDAVLAKAGSILQGLARPTDVIGRLGGEEFALLLPDVNGPVARHFAEALRAAIGEASVEYYGETISVTASLGVAEMRPGEDFDTLYARADQALYAAKHGGRNRVELVD